ncbi:MAG: arginase [Clostridiaceae bacterium]|nr:arginase [Clostridiaceae bacterium]
MKNCLLSVDWDYFVYTKKERVSSFSESKKSLVDLWYKRYLEAKTYGLDIKDSYKLSPSWENFWEGIKEKFTFEKGIRVQVSDSHTLSYDICRICGCNAVILFDAHSDLGYGGLSSLDFELNCSNWLGKLLKENIVKSAHIIYSPHTQEKPEYFKSITNKFNVKFSKYDDFDKNFTISQIHICRSGAWTPPWLDGKFFEFVNLLGLEYEITDCPKRHWNPENLSFSDKINYFLA